MTLYDADFTSHRETFHCSFPDHRILMFLSDEIASLKIALVTFVYLILHSLLHESLKTFYPGGGSLKQGACSKSAIAPCPN